MNIVIESLNQRLHFETQEVKNIVTIRLPSGVRIEAFVSEEDVSRLIHEVAGANTHLQAERPQRSQQQPTIPANTFPMNDEGVTSFGGSVSDDADDDTKAPPVPVTRAPTVQKDEAGNPVLSGAGFKSPESILGHNDGVRDQDEDGVAQA